VLQDTWVYIGTSEQAQAKGQLETDVMRLIRVLCNLFGNPGYRYVQVIDVVSPTEPHDAELLVVHPRQYSANIFPKQASHRKERYFVQATFQTVTSVATGAVEWWLRDQNCIDKKCSTV
jgi:hypothetical protein